MKILGWRHWWAISWRLFLTFGGMIFAGSLLTSIANGWTVFCSGIRSCDQAGVVESWGKFALANSPLTLLLIFILTFLLSKQFRFWTKIRAQGYENVEDVPDDLRN